MCQGRDNGFPVHGGLGDGLPGNHFPFAWRKANAEVLSFRVVGEPPRVCFTLACGTAGSRSCSIVLTRPTRKHSRACLRLPVPAVNSVLRVTTPPPPLPHAFYHSIILSFSQESHHVLRRLLPPTATPPSPPSRRKRRRKRRRRRFFFSASVFCTGGPAPREQAFRGPFSPWVPAMGIAVSWVLLSQLSWASLRWTLWAVGAVSLWYFTYG